ncbi:RepB family plasmid replication initiator protein [Sporolactobacillus shoreae]|uniref:RepB family plasmid replication initiator protein n=1 Tax=Sporolactobacillus shoreae TaxID=1465501 RepID=A0A4Z0GJ86_9BACL|nr:replication initiation protein [Sporolactobacillus shoreae]TGA96341.1 RepB family plasmid replication initiator protein [Sporolactobacillus shoreae]
MTRNVNLLIDRMPEKLRKMNARDYQVVKANALIQKTRYDLTLQEQKIILHVIQLIKPEDKEFHRYLLSIKEYCQICEMNYKSGKNYENIKKSLKSLRDKSFWLETENGTETLMSWLSKVRIFENKGTIEVELDNDLKPYLLELKKFFTKYKYLYVMAMRSNYSIRLYELLKSYENQRGIRLTIEQLRKMLGIGEKKLTKWYDIRRYVIDQAQKEINELTDIQVKYTTVKQGRSVYAVDFHIFTKDGKLQNVAQMRVENRLKKVKDDYRLLDSWGKDR